MFKKFFIFTSLLMMSSTSYANTSLKNKDSKQSVPSQKAIVLMYHRITEKKSSMALTPESFDLEMKYIHDNGYHVISAMYLIDAIINHTSIPEKSVVITFDDGWNTQIRAMQTLSKYHYPATFALITECANKPGYILKSDMEHFNNENFLYVNHSRTHDIKDFLNHPDYDVSTSKKELFDLTQKFVPVYVYPYGAKNSKLVSAIKNNGYIAAFGVGDGPVYINHTNIFNMNRYLINNDVTLNKFKNYLEQGN